MYVKHKKFTAQCLGCVSYAEAGIYMNFIILEIKILL
jgi:hypothetical protein